MFFPGLYQDHPERRDVIIFYYKSREFSECFCSLMREAGIYFESYEPVTDDPRFCVAVYRKNFKAALKLHEETLRRLKKPFIEDKIARWVVLGLFFLVLSLAIAGYLLSPAA